MRFVKICGFGVGLPALLVVLWWACSKDSTSIYMPKPISLTATFGEIWFSERFMLDVLPSLARLAGGVTLAIIIGIAAGLLIGSVRWLRDLLEPLLEFFRAVPPPVLVPLLILFLGVGDTMKVAVITSGCVWPVLMNTVEGVRATDSVTRDSARIYSLSGAASIRYLVLPSAAPQIMVGIRQCLSIGLILMVISEMFASSSGLGFTIVQFQRSFSIPEMWSGIVLLGLIGVVLSLIFQLAERSILRWYFGSKEADHAG
ncbi:ABC transporter permease [bacterium RCC_150]